MLRVLLLAGAVVLLVLLLRGGLRRARRDEPPPPAPPGRAGEPQPMVACAHCGVHLPRADALITDSGTFCGEAHRVQYERTHGNG